MPQVSIIIPIYNTSQYLLQCLDSIINQTLKDIEIILVNDGSTDNSLEICEKYASLDKRIKLFSKKNGGLSSAKNFGIQHCTGEYFGFVDSDDYVDITMFEKLFHAATTDSADLVSCAYYEVLETTNSQCSVIPKNSKSTSAPHKQVFNLNNKSDFIALSQDLTKQTIASWNKLYLTKKFRSLTFPYGKKFEDAFVYFELYNTAKTIVFIPEPLYYYRLLRPGSITNNAKNNKHIDIEFIDIMSKFVLDYYLFINPYNISQDIIFKKFRNFYNQILKYNNSQQYDIQKKTILNLLSLVDNNKIKSRYRVEMYLLKNYSKIYNFIRKNIS